MVLAWILCWLCSLQALNKWHGALRAASLPRQLPYQVLAGSREQRPGKGRPWVRRRAEGAGPSAEGQPAEQPEQGRQPAAELDWRDFRARLVAEELRQNGSAAAEGTEVEGWAHATPLIEQGSLLLAEPGDHFALNQQYFHKAMIFIIEHTDDFTRGVILNRPTAFSAGNLGSVLRPGRLGDFPATDDNSWNVWCGGDCEGINGPSRNMYYSCLHILERLAPNSTEIIKGAYTIDFSVAQLLVDSKQAAKEDFLLLVGYCGWGRGQLQGELDRGETWTLAAADRRAPLGRLRDLQAELTRRREAAGLAQVTAADLGDGIEEWERLYAALGPKFQQRVRGVPLDGHTDEMLRRWIDRCLIPPWLKVVPVVEQAEAGNATDVQLPQGTLMRGSATAWLLGKPSEVDDMDPAKINRLPSEYFHKGVFLLLRDYEQGDQELTLLVLLNGPPMGRPGSGVCFGGPSNLNQRGLVYEIRGPPVYRITGLVVLPPGQLELLLELGALEVVRGVELSDILSTPREDRWEAAGGRIRTVRDAVEAQLGDVQLQLWYKHFMDVDL